MSTKTTYFAVEVPDYAEVSCVEIWSADRGMERIDFHIVDIAPQQQQPTIDMVLYCHNCGKQHIDGADGKFLSGEFPCPEDSAEWNNPPHRSHLCHDCGCIWRPADIATNGVADIKTEGKADTWITHSEISAQPAAVPSEQVKTIYCVGNKVAKMFFASKENADRVVANSSPAAGLIVTEIQMLDAPSPAVVSGEAATECKSGDNDLFRAGARAVFDAILFRAANNYHPKCQEQCDRENAVITDWMIDALEEVSPADCSEWRSIDAAYQAGFNDGKTVRNTK